MCIYGKAMQSLLSFYFFIFAKEICLCSANDGLDSKY